MTSYRKFNNTDLIPTPKFLRKGNLILTEGGKLHQECASRNEAKRLSSQLTAKHGQYAVRRAD